MKKVAAGDLNSLGLEILQILKKHNLYQSFEDEKRLSKIQTSENASILSSYLRNGKDVIDNDMLSKPMKN